MTDEFEDVWVTQLGMPAWFWTCWSGALRRARQDIPSGDCWGKLQSQCLVIRHWTGRSLVRREEVLGCPPA